MAVAGVQLNINSEELRGFREKLLQQFRPQETVDILEAAVKKAIQPMTRKLREITPVGPTGNLERAVTSKVVKYAQSGVAVGIVGYTRAGESGSASAAGGSVRVGKDRAFHQWLLEFGTKRRVLTRISNKPYQRKSPTTPFTRVRLGNQETVRGKGVVHWVSGQNAVIASSFNRLGPFQVVKNEDRDGVQTNPAYPAAFFKKAKKGQPLIIEAAPAGGIKGIPPVQTAFDQTQGEIAAILQRELGLSLAEAWSALRYRDLGSVSGTDTLGPG